MYKYLNYRWSTCLYNATVGQASAYNATVCEVPAYKAAPLYRIKINTGKSVYSQKFYDDRSPSYSSKEPIYETILM